MSRSRAIRCAPSGVTGGSTRARDVRINCAAQTNVDRCETHPDEAFALNAEAPRVLAEICLTKGARLIHISTDYVFDGSKAYLYTEEDEAHPISVYGASKCAGKGLSSQWTVVTWWCVSRGSSSDCPSFVDWVIAQAREHEKVDAVADKFATPTYTHDIAELLKPLLVSSAPGGLLHLANRGGCSWREYGQWALDCCQAEGIALRAHEVGAITLADMKNFIARRPVHSVLATLKYERLTGETPRDWHEAVAAYVRDDVKPRMAV